MCQSTAHLTRKWRQEDKSFLEHAASSLLVLQDCRLRLFPLPVFTPALASDAGATPLTCAPQLLASLQLGAIRLANGCNSITGRHSSSLWLPYCFPLKPGTCSIDCRNSSALGGLSNDSCWLLHCALLRQMMRFMGARRVAKSVRSPQM